MSTEPNDDRAFDEDPDALLDALVRGERTAMTPPEGAQGETWERVAATLAIGGPPPLEPSSITGSSASATTAPWAKIVLGVVLGVVAVAGYRLASTANDPQPHLRAHANEVDVASVPTVVPAAQPRAEPPAAEPPAAEPPDAAPPPAGSGPAPTSSSARVGPKGKEPHVASRDLRGPSASDLAEETRLLALARRSLAAGSARDALTPLGEHARRFPSGQLTEDRMVLRAQALCESGQTDAGLEQASALRKAFPSSSHQPRVDRACAP